MSSRLFDLAKTKAVSAFGCQTAFDQLGSMLQKGLIARELLVILDQQDSDVPDKAVRALLAEFNANLEGSTT